MKNRPVHLFLIGLALVVASVVIPIGVYQFTPRALTHFMFQGKELNAHTVSLLADHIHKHYVDEVDRAVLMRQALQGMTENLDPYSYLIENEEKEGFDRLTSGELTGIGIEFGLREEGLLILQVFSNGPAEKAGLQSGDRFVEIAGEDVRQLKNTQRVVELIKGPIGTPVSLKIFRPSEDRELTVTAERNRVEIPSVRSHLFPDGILHLKLAQFQGHSDAQMREALDKVSSLKALVLDLRGNSGGRLDMAVRIASLFLPKDTVVVKEYYRDRDPKIHRVQKEGRWQKLPLTVLVDQFSASASEVLAGCLQDHKRATLWGQRTFGKGRVQELLTLENGKSLLKLTVARYVTPLGRDLGKSSDKQGGLEPDFLIEQKIQLPNEVYLKTLKDNWESLKIPYSFETFIEKYPPQRTEEGTEDLALQKALTYLRETIGL